MHHHLRIAFSLVLVVLAIPWHNAYGQSDCPFPDSVAVADTLDPKGYYPTQVGNVWEYTGMTGSGFMEDPFREEIMADTLIDGITFYKLKLTTFDYDFSPVITRSFTTFDYVAVADSGIVQWTPAGLLSNGIRFSQSFNSCYGPDPVAVAGGYGDFFSIMERDSVVTRVLPAQKTFWIPSAFSEVTYGYGVGRLQTVGDPSVTYDLSYAKIDSREFGTPLDSLFDIRVANEPLPVLPALRLENYPNPFVGATRFSFSLSVPGSVTLEIIDVLGRVIARPSVEVRLAPGRHETVWEARHLPSGVYFARLVLDNRTLATTTVIHLK